ncbi:MAG: protein-L-isoaspartate(D-aspartate) O-methyltransferase [Burkholderiales bacterium]
MSIALPRGIGMTSLRTRARMVARLRTQGIADEAVLAAMAETPRHAFVEEALASRAYEDSALPIGFEQTISRPFAVARMLQAARAGRELARALEIGTGCGYQAAVLARLAKEVYSVERIAALGDKARANLRPLRLSNLRLVHGDGYRGLPEVAPFDAIVVAAAAPEVPRLLREQLARGGRLVIPVGTDDQELRVVERTARGYRETRLEAARFVPLRAGKG